MKKHIVLLCTVAAGVLLAFSNQAAAGTITVTDGPSFMPPGAVTNNTVTLQQPNASLIQLFGNATIQVTPDSVVYLAIGGTFTADMGDIASLFYNFTVDLNSAIPVTFTLALTATPTSPPLPPIELMEEGDILQGSHQYTGMDQSAPAPFALSGTFSGMLIFKFGAAPPNPDGTTDTLFLQIPSDSIDFQIAPTAIPEPSSYALLGLGILGLSFVARRRKAALV